MKNPVRIFGAVAMSSKSKLTPENHKFFTGPGVPVSNLINVPDWPLTKGFINPPLVSDEMLQHIKATTSGAIKTFHETKKETL